MSMHAPSTVVAAPRGPGVGSPWITTTRSVPSWCRTRVSTAKGRPVAQAVLIAWRTRARSSRCWHCTSSSVLGRVSSAGSPSSSYIPGDHHQAALCGSRRYRPVTHDPAGRPDAGGVDARAAGAAPAEEVLRVRVGAGEAMTSLLVRGAARDSRRDAWRRVLDGHAPPTPNEAGRSDAGYRTSHPASAQSLAPADYCDPSVEGAPWSSAHRPCSRWR